MTPPEPEPERATRNEQGPCGTHPEKGKKAEVQHLYEVVISNPLVWMKMQASCSSREQSAAFFEARFNGTDYYTVDGHRPVTPFRLSERSHYVANWESTVDLLPAGWDDDEFQIAGDPYPWCELMSDDCDCRGTKGRLDEVYCSDYGLHHEIDKRASKSQNVRHLNYVRGMEEGIANRDRVQREERAKRQQATFPQAARPIITDRARQGGSYPGEEGALADVVNRVNRLVAQRFFCPIEGRYHRCSEKTKEKLMANGFAAVASSTEENRRVITSFMDSILTHWLKTYQSEECAERQVRGDPEVPPILYKYIPKDRIGKGAPDSLRATQIMALNDDMECNVVTMNSNDQLYALDFLALAQSKLEEHLGIEVPWEEILERSIRYGELRSSTFIQEYLNPRVGVVSFTTDMLVPTMWAHYARNTGIVVGYDTEILRNMGFELRPMIYSEIAPTFQPSRDDTIRLSFVDHQRIEESAREGETSEGRPIIADVNLVEMSADWKSLSRLLYVKGTSWAYEKEVRLLVDLQQARDTGKPDSNGWPIKVIYPPPEAIKEICRGANTQDADVARAIEIARGENKSGLLVQHVSSHAFRIQKTVGSYY